MNIVFATGYGPNYSFLDLGQAVVTTKKTGTLRFIWKYIITFSEYSFFIEICQKFVFGIWTMWHIKLY